jgi:hypothetical protein
LFDGLLGGLDRLDHCCAAVTPRICGRKREQRPRGTRGAAGGNVPRAGRRDPVADNRCDCVLTDYLKMERVLVSTMRSATVTDHSGHHEIEFGPIARLLFRYPRTALFAEVIAVREDRFARSAAKRSRVAHVHVLGRVRLA